MAKREFNGPPLDLTDGPGEQHITQRNGETVAGTTDDDNHNQETDAWPSALDKDNFSKMQKSIIEKLVMHPATQDSAISDMIGCSQESVRQVRHKVSAYTHPSTVPFRVPDEPTKTIKIVKSQLTEDGELPREKRETAEEVAKEAEENTSDTNTTESTGERERSELPQEKIISLYESGLSKAEIAERIDADKSRVIGLFGQLTKQGLIDNGGDDDQSEDTSKTTAVSGDPDPEETQVSNGESDVIEIELRIGELTEILEARGVCTETKQNILEQGEF